jgi:hypothetical protein
VVETGDGAADRLPDVTDEGAAAAADVEQPILLRQVERLKEIGPEEVVRARVAVRLAGGAAVRPACELVGPALEAPGL